MIKNGTHWIYAALFVWILGSLLILGLVALVSCSTVPTRQFNTEDKQDGNCYATLGGRSGYCNSNVIDVFDNTYYYNEFK